MSEETASSPHQYNSAERDKLEGSVKEAGGRVKESVGALAGDERLKAEGRAEQVSGTARRNKGSLKDRIKAWIDRL